MKVAVDSAPFRILFIQTLRNLYRDHGGASIPYDNFKTVFLKCIDLIHKEQSYGTLEDHCMKDSSVIRGNDEFVAKRIKLPDYYHSDNPFEPASHSWSKGPVEPDDRQPARSDNVDIRV